MFGSKLRSWMEAVRPRKKGQRKEKQPKTLANASNEFVTKFKTTKTSPSPANEMANVDSKSMQTIASQSGVTTTNGAARYSGANLSSPESAYSTGYSTDGTSPGAPPEYYINIRTGTRYFPSETTPGGDKCTTTPTGNHLAPTTPAQRPLPPLPTTLSSASQGPGNRRNLSPLGQRRGACSNGTSTTASAPVGSLGQDIDNGNATRCSNPNNNLSNGGVSANSAVMSPRQRNRIRTNPWVPGGTCNLSPCNSSMGLHAPLSPRLQNGETSRISAINSPRPMRYVSPTVPCSPVHRPARCASLSSSSCSSLSAASLNWDVNLVRDSPIRHNALQTPRFHSASDEEEEDEVDGAEEEEDCTLNEMMGKYDESYVYEKETDILSDSDPTDCETDIDTGQDGGDEDDPHEAEFDFIDNGSFLEFSIKDERVNTGHCTYYSFDAAQRKATSRKRNTRRSRKDSKTEKRKRSSSSKKRVRCEVQKPSAVPEGTRSAGATPVSMRRTKVPISKLALEESQSNGALRKRSNSVSIPRDAVHFFDQRDKEAEKKYKELIVEAERILKNMKCTPAAGSPRRVPGPPNKRVELLRTESAKPDAFLKNRLIEDVSNMHVTRAPSTFSPRFSPKRNHITKFISSNSPITIRRDCDQRSVNPMFQLGKVHASPMMQRRAFPCNELQSSARRSPMANRKKTFGSNARNAESLSSDSEIDDDATAKPTLKTNGAYNSCPQSEPVKRKIYYQGQPMEKCVAFNLAATATTHTRTEISMSINESYRKSCESLRQQVLLNTITNLKRSLEDQSASLKQVYRSSQNLHT